MSIEYSNIEYLEMVRCYISSGENLNSARRLYSEPSNLQRLRANGIAEPRIPSTDLILATYQRLIDHGQFRLPSYARGRGRPPLTNRQEAVVDTMLDDVPLNHLRGMYFQHDGCPAHYERSVCEYLDSQYPGNWIGRGGPVNWPARLPDLTPLDFYLWSELKRLVYTEEARSVNELKQRIIDAFDIVKSDRITLLSLKTNLQKRANLCLERNRGHFEQWLKYR